MPQTRDIKEQNCVEEMVKMFIYCVNFVNNKRLQIFGGDIFRSNDLPKYTYADTGINVGFHF
jgi:hypothetical protein